MQSNITAIAFFHSLDLQDVHNLETNFKEIISSIKKDNVSSIHLINNAGTVAPMKPIEKAESEQFITNVHINLLCTYDSYIYIYETYERLESR